MKFHQLKDAYLNGVLDNKFSLSNNNAVKCEIRPKPIVLSTVLKNFSYIADLKC